MLRSLSPSSFAGSEAALAPGRIVRAGLCVGCGACAAQEGVDARMVLDRFGRFKPEASRDWLAEPSEDLARACPFSPVARNEDELAAMRFPNAARSDARIGRFEAAYVGYADEGGFRENGSSGGMTSWVAAELLRRGLVDAVAHVTPTAHPQKGDVLFGYSISRTAAEVSAGAKSRYYPVELSRTIAAIRSTPGRYAVTGVPCFIKALQLLSAEDELLRERIAFYLGLFCGHMKSAALAESFAWQLGVAPDEIDAFDFRTKDARRPANWYRARIGCKDGGERAQDWWHLVDGDWGAGFFQYPACNFCDDVVAETADVSFGDAWLEPYASDGRGTNVVVVRSPPIQALLREAAAEGRVRLEEVDADFVHATQAAGFRQRREGLAWRLSRRRFGVRPNKRVAAQAPPLRARRKLVYRQRELISFWSHRMFWLAKRLRAPWLYTAWARLALGVYQACAHSRGRLGRLLDQIEAAAKGRGAKRP
ncbi:MAG TPA: Coenzyme F420 hydrogenase/dehydrogenase, beta subunit C-terminal domain [Vitreimonas sp.]|uniref:Coenzyme F420 hydrogenase/dehydrogenase, beta subunit C-terminal domain n=1 Tax=Vitreimonas sp. TaxID=3069702 RepID=UPI002D2C9B0E|nr:Coenzyme F420 hydrogenase/dehydrogenase, beta subunit C-terminal domain [Vitreimonas sp.]HYD88541.1 Coenzyme F420 hydrogenase/dehydrogenase, beta subunit C-terminal domain [Vitreimonas sp.]